MKTIEEFQAYFEREMRPRLAESQARREAERPRFWRVWRWWLLGFLGLIVLMFILSARHLLERFPLVAATMPVGAFTVLIVVPIVLNVRISRWHAKFATSEKQSTLVPAIRFLAPEFEYDPNAFVSPQRVSASGIFQMDGKLGKVEGDDRFVGKIGGTQVEFSEVVATTSRRVSTKNGHKTVYTKHQGLYLVADFNKPFQHRTVVLPDPGEQLLGAQVSGWLTTLGNIAQAANRANESLGGMVAGGLGGGLAGAFGGGFGAGASAGGGLQPVRMEHQGFEKLFQVLCTDKVEAFYILTPNVMERLTEFQSRVKFGLSLCFADSCMYAWLPAGALFEEDPSRDWTEFDSFRPYYEQLYVVFDLVEAMNLNARLWSKA